MKAKKRLQIIWETHEITSISFRQNRRATLFCRSCRTEALHLSVAEAAGALEINEAAIFRLAEAGAMHFAETAKGQLLICADSISAFAEENNK